jgi:hypothetical protein
MERSARHANRTSSGGRVAGEARKVAAELRKVVDDHVMPVRARWQAIAAGYSQYERARGVNVTGRLDAGEFPIQVAEMTAPIPMVLNPDADPTILTSVPTA